MNFANRIREWQETSAPCPYRTRTTLHYPIRSAKFIRGSSKTFFEQVSIALVVAHQVAWVAFSG
jgi:hypothetical protein